LPLQLWTLYSVVGGEGMKGTEGAWVGRPGTYYFHFKHWLGGTVWV